jgi:lysine-N-methylase
MPGDHSRAAPAATAGSGAREWNAFSPAEEVNFIDMPPRALRFMAAFRCIGPDCEDSCCANWQIDVDRHHFVKIARLLGRTREGQRELAAAFVDVPEDKRNPGRFMRMLLREDGGCAFWGADKFCTLQQRFGERVLPDVCAHYPRSFSTVRDEMELAGQLSCPEVARRCLLDADSCDLVEVDSARLARGGAKQRTWLECGDPYFERFFEVRETFEGVLTRRDYPMRSRLFFLLCFADRTAPFFHRGTNNFKEEDWTFERAAMNDPSILDELHTELGKVELPEGLALFTIAEVLAGDVQLRSGGRFRDVVTEVLDSFHAEMGAPETTAEEMWRVFVRRRDAKMARWGPRIEEFCEKYCRQFCVRDWYVDQVSIYPFIQALLVRVAVLRFLMLSHPSEDIDALAVRVVSSMSRGIEHHDAFLKLISEGLRDQIPTVLQTAALLFV